MKIASATLISTISGLMAVGMSYAHAQSTFSMQLVADNDFAVFTGTASSINNLLYQNNYAWNAQIANLSSLNFTMPAGDTMFYVLGLGGGGDENISGTVNGVDMTTVSVSMSTDLGAYLTGYGLQNQTGGTVEQGTFNVNLADVQAAFPNLGWGSPNINSSDTVISLAAPNHVGFHFDPSTAHLFAFNASAVSVPEPASIGLVVLGGVCLVACRKKK